MGQRNELLQVLHDLNRDYPGNRSTLNLGMALARMGDLEGAEASFRQALPYAELQIDAQFCLGMVLYEKGRSLWEAPKQRERARKIVLEAVDHLRTAVQRKPNYAQAHLYHGMAAHLLGQPQEAPEVVSPVHRVSARNGRWTFATGQIVGRTGTANRSPFVTGTGRATVRTGRHAGASGSGPGAGPELVFSFQCSVFSNPF